METFNKIFRPEMTYLDKPIIDIKSVVDKLTLASKLIPVPLKNLRENEKDTTVLKTLEGSNVCLESCYKHRYFAACLAYVDKESIVATHFHTSNDEKCYEIIYGLSGHVIFQMKNSKGILESYEVKSNDLLVIPPGEPHSIECLETGVLLCITIPSDPDFPDEEEKTMGQKNGN